MKKFIYIILASAAMLSAATSCKDILEAETQSSFDESVVFANYTLAESNIMSIYQVFTINNSYRNRFHLWYGYNTDIEWYNAASVDKPNDGKNQVAAYDPQVNETGVPLDATNGVYSLMYTAVERANICIANIRKYGNPSANKDMAYLLGEALTLRAMLYYDLTKAWGDVPARFEPISSETIYIPKTDRDDIYKQCIADLQEAAEYVYWPNEAPVTALTTRVNKAFVKGLLARFCLTAAGYALRPDDGMIGTGNQGSVRRSTRTQEGGEWAGNYLYDIALKACEDVIAKEGGCVNLATNFRKLWTDMMTYKNVNAGDEVLFVIPYGHETLRGQWNSQFAIAHQAADQYVGKKMGGSTGPVPSMYYEYGKTDERRDISCVNYVWSNSKSAVQEPAGFNKWYFGKFRYEWMTNGATIGASANDDGIKPIVMRYADILLMAAECANEMNDLTSAKTYLEKVRTRAYKSNKSAVADYMATIGNKQQMFNAIFEERALEFCGEMLRKADLIRWGLLGKAMDDVKGKMKALRNHGTYRSTVTGRNYDYSSVGTNLYYRMNGEEIEMYGLDYGQAGTPEGSGWTKWSETDADGKLNEEYIKEGKLKDERIDLIYLKNPDTRQYWPLFSSSIAANNKLVNDYGY